jgi:hypothetical protein
MEFVAIMEFTAVPRRCTGRLRVGVPDSAHGAAVAEADVTSPPPVPPDEVVASGTEREVLEAFLDFHRGVAVRKVNGLSEDDGWILLSDEKVAALVAEYTQTCRMSREAASTVALEDAVPPEGLGRVSYGGSPCT